MGEDASTVAAARAHRSPEALRALAREKLAGAPRDRDVGGALALFDAACSAGDTCACVERAAALVTFDGRSPALGEAMRLYEGACESTSRTRCREPRASTPAASAGYVHFGGASAEMVACYNWSRLVASGAATAPDAEDATVLRARACDGGVPLACAASPPSGPEK